ncbi:hypothetical protein [Alkalibacillus silvisoli]|uniref:Uncharacterized protein n=1 Tax=Alkalibacillus silvisoli TaxID=392823 RepID=A0ABN0ZPU0_9BACI
MRQKKQQQPNNRANPQSKTGSRAFTQQDRKRKEQNYYNRGGF